MKVHSKPAPETTTTTTITEEATTETEVNTVETGDSNYLTEYTVLLGVAISMIIWMRKKKEQ